MTTDEARERAHEASEPESRLTEHRRLAAARAEIWEVFNSVFGAEWTDTKHRGSRAIADLEHRAFMAGRATERRSAARKASK